MINCMLLVVLVSLTTTSLLRIWLHSRLTNSIIEYLLVKRNNLALVTSRWAILPKMALQLITCWQCLSVWIGCALAFAGTYIFSLTANRITFYLVSLCVGLSSALVSEILDYYVLSAISVTHIDEEDLRNDR